LKEVPRRDEDERDDDERDVDERVDLRAGGIPVLLTRGMKFGTSLYGSRA
jgi:hypothetical protein